MPIYDHVNGGYVSLPSLLFMMLLIAGIIRYRQTLRNNNKDVETFMIKDKEFRAIKDILPIADNLNSIQSQILSPAVLNVFNQETKTFDDSNIGGLDQEILNVAQWLANKKLPDVIPDPLNDVWSTKCTINVPTIGDVTADISIDQLLGLKALQIGYINGQKEQLNGVNYQIIGQTTASLKDNTNLILSGKGSIEGLSGVNLQVKVTISGVKADSGTVTANGHIDNTIISIDKGLISDIKFSYDDINVNITGLPSQYELLLNAIVEAVTKLFNDEILSAISQPITDAINDAINDQLPQSIDLGTIVPDHFKNVFINGKRVTPKWPLLTNGDYGLKFEIWACLEIYDKHGASIWISNPKIFPPNYPKTPPHDYSLSMQSDNNLVLYDDTDSKVIWATNTEGQGNGPAQLVLSAIGILSLICDDGTILWSSVGINDINNGINTRPLLSNDVTGTYPISIIDQALLNTITNALNQDRVYFIPDPYENIDGSPIFSGQGSDSWHGLHYEYDIDIKNFRKQSSLHINFIQGISSTTTYDKLDPYKSSITIIASVSANLKNQLYVGYHAQAKAGVGPLDPAKYTYNKDLYIDNLGIDIGYIELNINIDHGKIILLSTSNIDQVKVSYDDIHLPGVDDPINFFLKNLAKSQLDNHLPDIQNVIKNGANKAIKSELPITIDLNNI